LRDGEVKRLRRLKVDHRGLTATASARTGDVPLVLIIDDDPAMAEFVERLATPNFCSRLSRRATRTI
jgi:hypothetical protein